MDLPQMKPAGGRLPMVWLTSVSMDSHMMRKSAGGKLSTVL